MTLNDGDIIYSAETGQWFRLTIAICQRCGGDDWEIAEGPRRAQCAFCKTMTPPERTPLDPVQEAVERIRAFNDRLQSALEILRLLEPA